VSLPSPTVIDGKELIERRIGGDGARDHPLHRGRPLEHSGEHRRQAVDAASRVWFVDDGAHRRSVEQWNGFAGVSGRTERRTVSRST
jgi:hypothetical protein